MGTAIAAATAMLVFFCLGTVLASAWHEATVGEANRKLRVKYAEMEKQLADKRSQVAHLTRHCDSLLTKQGQLIDERDEYRKLKTTCARMRELLETYRIKDEENETTTKST